MEIKEEAEQTYIHEVQKALAKRVWNAGCASVSLLLLRNLIDRAYSIFSGISTRRSGIPWLILGARLTFGGAVCFPRGRTGTSRSVHDLDELPMLVY